MATGALGCPNHPVTNFIAGSIAFEYVATPASWPRKLNNIKGGLDSPAYCAITNVGIAVPSFSHRHLPLVRRSAPSPSTKLPLLDEQITVGRASPSSRSALTIALNSLPAVRAFHRSTTSNRPFPSEKSAASVVIGYHATYPAPRTPVNDGAI